MQKWAVRVGELQYHLLSTEPHILHFSGHGDRSGAILLQEDDGTSRPVSAASLARVLAIFTPRLRCVVLNACHTAAQAAAIAEEIDCVVVMSAAIADRAAIRFAAAFYLAIAFGRSVHDAFQSALAELPLAATGGDEVPVLLARRCDPREVILARPVH